MWRGSYLVVARLFELDLQTTMDIRVLSNFPFLHLVVVKEFTATLSGLGPKKRPKAQMPMALPLARLLDLMWFKQFALAANQALCHSTNFSMPKMAKRLINHQSSKSKIPINSSKPPRYVERLHNPYLMAYIQQTRTSVKTGWMAWLA